MFFLSPLFAVELIALSILLTEFIEVSDGSAFLLVQAAF